MTYKILVTGGAGYLGSIMVPELLRQGHRVTVLDNFMYRQNSLAHVCSDPKFDVVDGDARLQDVVAPLLKDADIVIPLAAFVGAPLCKRDPIGATAINRDAILMLLKMIGRGQRILMPTTNSAYGSGGKGNLCDETSPLKPISHYAREKVEIEKALLQHENAISFRLATVFGMSPRMRVDLLVNDFTYRAVTDRFVVLFEGHFKRNYIHVRDVTRVFLHCLEKFDAMRGQIYNVGLSNANLSKVELCAIIRKFVPAFTALEAPVGKDADQRNYVVSNAKIEATGFRPVHSVANGVRELIKGYRTLRNTVYGNL
jgi:nucleoside-diphosphate-sugar epimerase